MQVPSPSYAATVAHRLTTFLLVATIGIGVFLAVDAVTGAPRDVTFRASAPLDFTKFPQGVTPADDADLAVQLERPSAREQRLALAHDLLPIALAAAVLWFLRGVARSVRDGDPFIPDNVRRLRVIGGLLLAGVLAVHFAGDAINDALADPYTSSPSRRLRDQGSDLPITALLCGLGAFVLAQVFAHGVRLREDVDATI